MLQYNEDDEFELKSDNSTETKFIETNSSLLKGQDVSKNKKLDEFFDEEGLIRSDVFANIQQEQSQYHRVFSNVKNNIMNGKIAKFTNNTIELKWIPLTSMGSQDLIDFKNLLNIVRKNYLGVFKTGNNNLIYVNQLSGVYTQIVYIILNDIYKQLESSIKPGQSKKTVTKKTFNAQVITYVQSDDKFMKEFLFNLFIQEFSDTILKKTSERTPLEQKKSYNTYNAPTSIKYEIPDVSSRIYTSIQYTKLKTLFNECKQLLLFEYNESRAKGKNKSEKTIQQATITSDLSSLESADDVRVFDIKGKDNKTIPDYFQVPSNNFYITFNKNKYYEVQPVKFNQSDRSLTIKILNDVNKEELLKEIKSANRQLTYADTFGAKYDLNAKAPSSKNSSVWEKIKKSTDIIGLSGQQSIFKTAIGKTLTAISGDMKDLVKVWMDGKDPKQSFQTGTDNNIRYNILMLFKMYVSTIGNVNSLLKMELYPTALPMLANHLDKYDSFVKYIFEAINYIFSEYINDNPGYDVKKSSILAYMKKRQFFSGNVMSEDFFINRLYNLIIEEADDTQTPHSDGVEDVQPTEDTPDETIANEDGIDDTKQNKNNGRDPKSTAVLIIKSTSWQTIIEQVINYLTSIKAIK